MLSHKEKSSNPIRVYYLGSGIIGLPVVNALKNDPRIELVGCGTQPDRPQGRKRTLAPTAIGHWCSEHDLSVDKFESINTQDSTALLESLNIDVLLVFSFGQILKQEVLDIPKLHCINIHASLLPKYRGASPVNASILNGDEKTGISLMEMGRGLDSGPVYKQYEMAVHKNEKYDSLHDRLGELAGMHICDAICEIVDEKLEPVVQDESEVSIVRKINKKEGQIDWNLSAEKIERMVRAYYPWPGAYFFMSANGKERKITIREAGVCEDDKKYSPGQIVMADKHGWRVACSNGVLEIQKLIPNGKKEMSGAEFIRGCQLEPGSFINEADNCKQREPANKNWTCS